MVLQSNLRTSMPDLHPFWELPIVPRPPVQTARLPQDMISVVARHSEIGRKTERARRCMGGTLDYLAQNSIAHSS